MLAELGRVFHRHEVETLTLKRMLVHPKDKHTPQENLGVMYEVPCMDRHYVHTGKTERRYGVREKESKRDRCEDTG